jgi:hypothetical protein
MSEGGGPTRSKCEAYERPCCALPHRQPTLAHRTLRHHRKSPDRRQSRRDACPHRPIGRAAQRYGRCSAASAYHTRLMYSCHMLVGQRYGRCSAASAYHIRLIYRYPILVGQRYGRCTAASAYYQLRPHSYSTTTECPNRPGINGPVVRHTPQLTSKRRSSTCSRRRAEQRKEQRKAVGSRTIGSMGRSAPRQMACTKGSASADFCFCS